MDNFSQHIWHYLIVHLQNCSGIWKPKSHIYQDQLGSLMLQVILIIIEPVKFIFLNAKGSQMGDVPAGAAI